MGNQEARVWVSRRQGDGADPRLRQIIDEAIQIHGATGVSQWTPLARMYASQRTLRLADGPDEVHWHVVGRAEINRYANDSAAGHRARPRSPSSAASSPARPDRIGVSEVGKPAL